MKKQIFEKGISMKVRDNGSALGISQRAFEVIDNAGTQRGSDLRIPVRDAQTQRVYDSTGAFLVGELERLDLTINLPLSDVTFGRDIDIRSDVGIGDDASSFTQTAFASAGALGDGNGAGNGKAWASKKGNAISGIDVDTGKVANPLMPWALELQYSLFELESAAVLGRPIDQTKYEGLKMKHQMDTDEQVYVGDTSLGFKGLANYALITPTALANGGGGSPKWTVKTPDEILTDVNLMLQTTWANSGFAVMPNRILLPPSVFGALATKLISSAGNISVLKYILDNNILKASGQGELTVLPVKWLTGSGVGGTLGNAATTNRAIVYTKNERFVRFPMTPIQRTPVQFHSIYHNSTYYCKLGVVEFIYPETVSYWDGV